MMISGVSHLGSLELEQFLSNNHFTSISPIIRPTLGRVTNSISTTVSHSDMTHDDMIKPFSLLIKRQSRRVGGYYLLYHQRVMV